MRRYINSVDLHLNNLDLAMYPRLDLDSNLDLLSQEGSDSYRRRQSIMQVSSPALRMSACHVIPNCACLVSLHTQLRMSATSYVTSFPSLMYPSHCACLHVMCDFISQLDVPANHKTACRYLEVWLDQSLACSQFSIEILKSFILSFLGSFAIFTQ